MYLLVSLLQLNALVAGNGSYILRPCGHDLHGPTVSHSIHRGATNDERTQIFVYFSVNTFYFIILEQ